MGLLGPCHCHCEIIHEKSLALQGIKAQHFALKENYKSLELYGFSDASEKAFGASIYLRCTNSSEQLSMRLLCSKSRIASIKRISIPRLEFCAAGILSKLVKKSQIQEITKSYCWQHIRSEQNPSDLVSRGLSPESLENCELWWKDPETFATLFPIVNFVLRFARNAKNPHNKRREPLTSEELTDAEHCLVRRVHAREFSEDFKMLERSETVSSNSKLKSLNSFIYDKGIIRVGCRLGNSELDYGSKYSIVLLAKSKFTYILMLHFHNKFYHLGPQSLLHSVRHRFWPISGRNLARKVVHECVICFKAKPRLETQILGTLSKERTTWSPPFNDVGVDFCGPFLIKNKTQKKNNLYKVYIAIFVCFVTKAMHIELVTNLTSEALIACLKRFFARRGKSADIYSDNAGNFVGANVELKRLFQLVMNSNGPINSFLFSEGISWKFIPPRSPNFRGLWESCAKSVKYHLRRVVGNARLTYEELSTVLAPIEAVFNSRPISPLSSDPNDYQALTQGHFLIGRSLTSIPELDLLNI
ncbi:integrase catalytic domain-containing protein [Trichonephila clavipes]|nr:integrase catalytic domain-containing protein [Trichonephila clavipes]